MDDSTESVHDSVPSSKYSLSRSPSLTLMLDRLRDSVDMGVRARPPAVLTRIVDSRSAAAAAARTFVDFVKTRLSVRRKARAIDVRGGWR